MLLLLQNECFLTVVQTEWHSTKTIPVPQVLTTITSLIKSNAHLALLLLFFHYMQAAPILSGLLFFLALLILQGSYLQTAKEEFYSNTQVTAMLQVNVYLQLI
ncbi:hypothetical protein SS15_06995 [Enterobacter roggenkampii]|nr:hypothetical protein SS15_06995 [Enterobacter roggenkampii]KJP83523.1 hypothetical protein SR65_06080 [Enterobacter roggenkampii]KLP38441.1 hypothetical protein ABF66_09825 [Enterobacter roggenkampii]OBS90612.1 hypothetical protein AYL25_21340 [Enterobacter roggenkampii]